jgi:hypothetical protein
MGGEAASESEEEGMARRDAEVAHRNIRFGLWAADRLGLIGEERETYALAVHFADGTAPGFDDVIAKVGRDLAASGRAVEERDLRELFHEMMDRAVLDVAAEAAEDGP